MSPVTPGQIVCGKYVVERVLGVGAMGIVVAARHVTLDRPVAIKVLAGAPYGTREEAYARFVTEARAAARIESDHVCRVFDVGVLDTGEPFMVMEHLEGNDVERELERRGQLSISEAVDVVLQAADAIAAAHALGVVHRDLKPANLFLSLRPDGSRRLKVLDFGISKTRDDDAVDTAAGGPGHSIGTPAYMSPEQIRAPSSVDARTDVWALGAILYELVTGQTAFVGPNVPAILEMVTQDDPCPMNALRRNVPRELEAIVMRCLARDREERWSSVAQLAAALAPFGTLGTVSHLASVHRELGSRAPLRVTSSPSVEPMVANVRGEDTAPDVEELLARESIALGWREQRARTRRANGAVLLLASLTALAGTIAVVLHATSNAPQEGGGARAARVAASPPPAVVPLPAPALPAAASATTRVVHVYSAPSSLSSTRIGPAPPVASQALPAALPVEGKSPRARE